MSPPPPAASSSSKPSEDVLWSLSSETEGLKTILVLGGSYGGLRAARVLTEGAAGEELKKKGYRVVVVDRNDHFNHLYILPRVSVLDEYAQSAFIPVSLPSPHTYLHSTLLSLSPTHATISLPPSSPTPTLLKIPYTYLVYALGGTLPRPIDLSHADGTKQTGVKMLSAMRERVDGLGEGGRVLVVGGGALGIQLATDVREGRWKDGGKREVVLLHSREQLLNRFDPFMHEQTKKRFDAIGVTYHLGERAIIPPEGLDLESTKPKIVTTTTGRQIPCDIILMCNGQTPLSHHLIPNFPSSIDPATKLIRVAKTTQIITSPSSSEGGAVPVNGGRMFAIGDCCYQQDVIMAGYTAYNQGSVAAANILKMISHSHSPTTTSTSSTAEALKLDEYEWEPPAIKLTLGLKDYVIQTTSEIEGEKFKVGSDGAEDLGVDGMWDFFGVGDLPRSA